MCQSSSQSNNHTFKWTGPILKGRGAGGRSVPGSYQLAPGGGPAEIRETLWSQTKRSKVNWVLMLARLAPPG